MGNCGSKIVPFTPQTCAICFEEMHDWYKLDCGHSFHMDCVAKWLALFSRNSDCPVCRQSIYI